MFRTEGIIDERLLREIGDELLPTGYRRYVAALEVVLVLLLVMATALREYAWTAVMLLCAVAVPVTYALSKRRVLRVNLGRMRETVGRERVRYVTRLEEDGMHVENRDTGATACLAYECLARLCETKDAYVLITKTHQAIPAFKDGLGDREAFVAFLSAKAPAMRRPRRRGVGR